MKYKIDRAMRASRGVSLLLACLLATLSPLGHALGEAPDSTVFVDMAVEPTPETVPAVPDEPVFVDDSIAPPPPAESSVSAAAGDDSAGIVPPIATGDEVLWPAHADEPASLVLATFDIPHVGRGETLRLSVPLAFFHEGQQYTTNLQTALSDTFIDDSLQAPVAYDQNIATLLAYATVSLAPGAADALPLDTQSLSIDGNVIRDGFNQGYATLDGLRVAKDAAPGRYTLPLTVTWREKAPDAPEQTTTVWASFDIDDTFVDDTLYDNLVLSILDVPQDEDEAPQAMGLPWGDDAIIVYTFDELREAIQGGQYGTVYLGYSDANQGTLSFTDDRGIAISRSITIDGTDPTTGRRMTMVDGNSQGYNAAMYAAADGLSITVCNMDYTGRNYYSVVNGADRRNVATHYVNVTYTGRQLAHNYGAGSTVTVSDSTVYLQDIGSGGPHELAETTAITFYGDNTIVRGAPADNSVIWLRGTGEHSIVIAEGANVTIQTTNYVVLPEASANASLAVYGTLSVSTSGPNGCMTYGDTYFGTVTVPASGTLKIEHRNTVWPSLRVVNLTVGGTLDIARSNANGTVIAVQGGGSVAFNTPKLVRLANGNGSLMRTVTGTAAMTWTTAVINRYARSTALAVWNNGDLSAFTANITLTADGGTVGSVSGLEDDQRGAAIGSIVLAGGNLQLMSSTRLILGQATLSVDPPAVGQNVVTGRADPGAFVDIVEYDYYPGIGLGMLVQDTETTTDAGGRFSTASSPFPYPIGDVDKRVYARSDNGALICYAYASPVPRGLSFLHVPETLAFETAALSAQDQLIGRVDPDWHIDIQDSRSSRTGFSVYGRTLAPLTSSSGDVLSGALVYREGDRLYSLDGGDVLVARYASSDSASSYTIQWPADEGLLVRLPAFEGIPGEAYSATLVWTLTEGP